MVIGRTSADPVLTPLRVLFVLANPVDLTPFDEARVWREVAEALEPLEARASMVIERLADPTENALKRSLEQGRWHALHLVVHAHERRAARYGTIALQSADGHARNVTAGYLAKLVAGSPSVRLVVLQACRGAGGCFDTVAKALLEQGVAVVALAPELNGARLRIFVSTLYAAVLAGLGADDLSRDLQTALAGDDAEAGAVRLASRDAKEPIVAAREPELMMMAPAAEAGLPGPVIAPPKEPKAREHGWQLELQRKRASGEFDVFLCHNSADKPAVKRIAQQLRAAGVLPWLDAWELPPGQPWQPLLERQIGSIRSAAVFVGAAGMGPWQEQEMYGFLREFVARKAPVIPVLLPGAPSAPGLPIFLRAMRWVDFRSDDPNPLELLIWGITGKRPSD